jgi:phytanoyl-CoA hydroxylase
LVSSVAEAPGRSSELDALFRDGYVVVKGGLAPDLIETANAELDEFKARNRRAVRANLDDAGRLWRVVNLHGALDGLASLFSDNEALAVSDGFFGAETVLYTSLFFERGSEQALHRDVPVNVTRPLGKYMGMWAALDDVADDNGPLLVVPGSHTLPPIDIEAMAVELYGDPTKAPEHDDVAWKKYQTAARAQVAAHGLTPTEVHISAGDVIVWHPQMVHGGAPHRAERTRRSLAMHVTPINTPVYHQDAFFDPSKAVAETEPREYVEHHGRRIEKIRDVDFAHRYTRPVSDLHRPGAGPGERLEVAARQMKHGLGRLHNGRG